MTRRPKQAIDGQAISRWWSATRRLVTEIIQNNVEAPFRDSLIVVWKRMQASATHPSLSVLPALACHVAGGEAERALPACACWALVRLAAKLFDDIEDGDLQPCQEHPSASSVNSALGLVYLSQLALLSLSSAEPAVDRMCPAIERFCSACLQACTGQHDDMLVSSGEAALDPDGWIAIAQKKSGALFGWATEGGAMIAGASPGVCAAYQTYGMQLGVLVQLSDDYDGVWFPESRSDLVSGCPNVAVAYARFVAQGKERATLERDLMRSRSEDAEAEARAIEVLVRLGAQSYLLTVAQVIRLEALAALKPVAGDQEIAPLADLLDDVMPAPTI